MSKQDRSKIEARALIDITFWFKGHHYRSQIRHTLTSLVHLYNIKGLLRSLLTGEPYLTWFGHLDDCCDYWTPIHMPDGSINPEVERAFMLDDELGLDMEKEL